MKAKTKVKTGAIRIDPSILMDAKLISIQKGYNTLQEYVTEAVKEKNKREK